ncbi:amidohydrolase family protein [Wenzhouxiangella limi]|uniref:Amidohydrolase family protein n=1 Tax=Wenzhouxiangella limi TaxID=2707351 RepID=A0A845UY62_9GAMM|nr:amidohydrolase family protein [Wenzhouxiangella limi]NDY95444.1 amidohydrolase family protein [Wenzhouxiangella limi]
MITEARSLLILFALLLAGPAPADITALVGATVHPVSAEAIENGVVLIEDERIQAVGADLPIPDDAEVIDLAGLHLYPGFVHPATQLGLTEISSVPGSVDTDEMGSINAALRAEVSVNHDSALLPVAVAGGVLNAHIMPGGGLIRGTSAMLRLDGWSWEEMVLQTPTAMHLAFPSGAAGDEDNEDLALIDETLEKARHWHAAEAAAARGEAPRPARNDQLEALGPLLAGEVPLMIHANGIAVIETALDWAEAQQFKRVILSANADVQYAAERLAADGIPVILRGVYNMPVRRWEAYDMAYVAADRLHQAGVLFAIGDSGGGMDVANARNLPFHAGSAAAHGLPKDAALKSVTLWPAEILGAGDQIGSIEPGKQASLFAATGDPLEPMTKIRRVWIDGAEYDLMRDRHRRLYQRYRQHQQAEAR